LSLLLVVWIGEAAWEFDAMELEQYHSRKHDFSLILAIIIVIREVQLNDSSSIDTIATRQFTPITRLCLLLSIVERMLELGCIHDVIPIIERGDNFHHVEEEETKTRIRRDEQEQRTRRTSLLPSNSSLN